jgi:hypothetical protein
MLDQLQLPQATLGQNLEVEVLIAKCPKLSLQKLINPSALNSYILSPSRTKLYILSD